MHWIEKAVLKKDSAHLSLPVIQVLCFKRELLIHMDKEIAEKIALVTQQSSFILDIYLYELKNKLDPDEFSEYCQKFGKIMGAIYTQVLNPIWEEYPDLLPEKMGGPYNTDDEHYKNIGKLIMSQIDNKIQET